MSDLMHPVFHCRITHAFVQCVCRQDQDEVSSPLDALNQLVLKFSRLQLLHIDEDAEASNLQVHLQEAGDERRNKSEESVKETRY